MHVDQAALRMADEATAPRPVARHVDGPPRLAPSVYHGDHIVPGGEVQEAIEVGHVAGQEEALVRTSTPSRFLPYPRPGLGRVDLHRLDEVIIALLFLLEMEHVEMRGDRGVEAQRCRADLRTVEVVEPRLEAWLGQGDSLSGGRIAHDVDGLQGWGIGVGTSTTGG